MKLEERDLKDETELECLLKKNPDQIEKGLKIIDNQVTTPKGRIDLLGVDADGALTVVELKVKRDDDHLKQAINYFDWVLVNSPWVAKVYPKFKIDPKYLPKIILIAPDFTNSVITGSKYFGSFVTDLTLLKYTVVGYEEKYVVCTEVKIPDISQIFEEPRTIAEEIEYIKNASVREACKETIEQIKKIGKDVEPKTTKSGLVFKYQGRNFAAIYSRREFFYLEWKQEDGWENEAIRKLDKAVEIINNKITKAYELMGGKIAKTRKE